MPRRSPRADRQRVRTLAIGAGLVTGLAAAGAVAGAEVPRLEGSDCVTPALEAAGADCFTLFVPEDHGASDAHEDAPTLELPVAVLEPDSAAAEPPTAPVFFFPGGPGYSVLGAPELIAQYRKDVGARTLVLLDHRGMLHARPALRCPGYAAVSPYHNPVFAPAVSGAQGTGERARSITREVERCFAKLEGEGVDVAQYNAHAVAHDVEALRRALGYGRIDLYGRSTGGGTALTYLAVHPESVRAAVLVSPWYPSLRNRSPVHELHTLAQKYTDVLAQCARESSACRERVPDWLLAVERARNALDETPWVARVPVEGGPDSTLRVDGTTFLHALYLFLPSVYDELPALVADVARGDRTRLPGLLRLDRLSPRNEAPRYALGYFLAHVCNGMGESRPTRAESLRMLEREPALLGFEPPWACGWWGTDGAVPLDHNALPRSDRPVLSIHGQMDACCDVRWGRHLEQTLTNVRVVELQGLGHTPEDACSASLISAFLADPDAALDDGCKDDAPLRPWKLDPAEAERGSPEDGPVVDMGGPGYPAAASAGTARW